MRHNIFIGLYWAICICNLANVTLDEMELELAKRFVLKNQPDFPDITVIVKSPVIQCMSSALPVMHLAMNIAVSTAVNESSFSCLKLILTPPRMSMLHQRKADLILNSFERRVAQPVASNPPPHDVGAQPPSFDSDNIANMFFIRHDEK